MHHTSIILSVILVLFCGVAEAQTPETPPSHVNTSDIDRNWGPVANGIRADLSLDKRTYSVDEDVPLHIAIENVSANQPIYGEPFRPHDGFYGRRPSSVKLVVQDEDGPLTPQFVVSNLPLGGGPVVCPSPLLPGKPTYIEDSLHRFGLLPSKPGTYKITVTWSPYTSDLPTCDTRLTGLVAGPHAPPPRPIFSVASNPVYISIYRF